MLAAIVFPLPGQEVRAVVTGTVLLAGATDSLPAPGAEVTLHRVASDSQGPVASVTARPDGRFMIDSRVAAGGVLLISARWDGIEYFAPPVDSGVPVTVIVHPTAVDAPVSVALRSVIVGGPAADGTRDVIDLIVIRNRGPATRVALDTLSETIRMFLPPNADNVLVAYADFIQEAADVHGDTLLIHSPIAPGDRQIMLQYQIAPNSRRFVIPVDPMADTSMVLAEEADVSVTGFTRSGTEDLEGKSFQRWSMGRASGIELVLPGHLVIPSWLIPVMLLVMGVGLGYLTWRGLLSPRSR